METVATVVIFVGPSFGWRFSSSAPQLPRYGAALALEKQVDLRINQFDSDIFLKAFNTMSWRVIVRFSLDNDDGSAVRNQVASTLRGADIERTATGTWEKEHADPEEAATQLREVLQLLADSSEIEGASPHAVLDHIWINIDRRVSGE